MARREEELGRGPLGPNAPPTGMPPHNIAQGSHNFYAELLQGLDPSIAATIENQLNPMWGAYAQEPTLASDAPLNLGLGSWGALPNRDFNPAFQPSNTFGVPFNGAQTPNIMNPMGQGSALPGNVAENGFFNSFSMSGDDHPSPILSFNTIGAEGQQLYGEAMSHWQQPTTTTASVPSTRSYDLFGSSDVFHEPESAGQPGVHVRNLVPPPSTPSPIAPAPPTTSPASQVTNTKPSYSDVTKNKPPVGKSKTKARSRANSAHSLKDEHITGASSQSGKGSSQRKGRNNLPPLNRTKSVPFEPTTIQPNSRYGLDTFDEPPKGCSKNKDLCSKSSQSSDSLPQSRKGSTSSVGSSLSGVDDITILSKTYDTGCKTNDSLGKEETATTKVSSPVQNVEPPSKPEPTKSPNSAPSASKRATKETPFFDPRRIFAKQEGNGAPSKQKEYVPNNQQAKRPSPDPLLNNGKPKSNLTSSINRSCYINNDLRDSRKQTNAKSAQTQTTPSHNRNEGSNGQGNSATKDSAPRSSSQAAPQQAPSQQSQPKPSTNQKRRVNVGTDRRRKDDAPLTKPKRVKREVESTSGGPHILSVWFHNAWEWTVWGGQELFFILWNITKLVLSLGLLMVLLFGQYFVLVCKKSWEFVCTHVPFLNRGASKGQDEGPGGKGRPAGLKENITLPTTGEEAMKRLLACRGKDPYSILGVRADATDEDIKKYYRKQAVLVHPDKNQQPGAEEAFKILGHAFELIGDSSKRGAYDAKRCESDQAETAMQEFADMLTKLHDKLQEAANLMRCENCGGKHRRVPTERPIYAARFCDRCNIKHPAKEGDVWAESRILGFLWHYYACMDGKVYDITEWASCQSEHFKRIQANAHHVIYRISTNSSRQRQNSNRSNNEAELEDFLSHLFHQTGQKQGAGAGGDAEGFTYGGAAQPHAKWSGPQGGTAATGAAKKAKCRRKKGRH